MKPLRAGVVGVGHLGQHHARLYAESPHTRLAAVADIDPDRAEQIGRRHGVPFYTDLTTLIQSVQVVSIAVPTTSHYAVAKACLDAGLHVLIEKPIAATMTEALDLVDLASAKGCILQVGHVERFNAIILETSPYIVEPVFVECQRLSPFGDRGLDVDVVLDLMIHDLDLLASMNLGSIEDVSATGAAIRSPHVDLATARVTFAGGCVANLTASRVSPSRVRKLHVFQQEEYMNIDLHAKRGVVSRRNGLHEALPGIETKAISCDHFVEPLRLQIEDFLQAVGTGSSPRVSGTDASATLALAVRVQEAIFRNRARHQASAPGLVVQNL